MDPYSGDDRAAAYRRDRTGSEPSAVGRQAGAADPDCSEQQAVKVEIGVDGDFERGFVAGAFSRRGARRFAQAALRGRPGSKADRRDKGGGTYDKGEPGARHGATLFPQG